MSAHQIHASEFFMSTTLRPGALNPLRARSQDRRGQEPETRPQPHSPGVGVEREKTVEQYYLSVKLKQTAVSPFMGMNKIIEKDM